MLEEGAVSKIADLGRESVEHVIKADDGRQIILTPDGYKATEVPPVNPVLPDHIRQVVKLDSAVSLIDYVNVFKDAASRLFVSVAATRIVAELDYHMEGAAHRAHRAVWDMPVSEQWKRWTSIDGQSLPQQKFAEFIEENIEDIREPDGAKVLEVATYLQAKKKVSFESGIRLSDGQVQLSYQEDTEHRTKGNVTVPTEIKIGVPVFFGGDIYAVRCFLRWRIGDDGKLSFAITMHRRQLILQDAVQSAAKVVSDATGLGALFGMPA